MLPRIVGLITRMGRVAAERRLETMITAMQPPFCKMGTWVDEKLGVYMGWVLPKNPSSWELPLCNERRDVTLLFSGSDFSDPWVKTRLKERGHTFESKGQSYLVHWYEEDPSFLNDLNGRFHGIVIDRARETATLFNDRYGMQRIYYSESTDGFYFAAEAKALLHGLPGSRAVNDKSMGEFIACGSVLENRTLFQNVYVLPCAAKWVFRDGAIEKKDTYFDHREWEEQTPQEPQSHYGNLRDVFSQHLSRYFNGEERVGMSLTGGLDTRAIMAWHKAPPGSLPCYTFGGMLRNCRDVTVARRVASVCFQPHQVIQVGEEFLGKFSRYAERAVFLTDGCISVRHAPDLYLNERVAQIAPVRMTGNYGDEVLRRMRVFRPVHSEPGLFCPDFVSQVQGAHETYAQLVRSHPLSFALFQQAPWHQYGLMALEQSQIDVRTPYLDNDFVREAFRAPESASTNNDLRLRLISDGNPTLSKIRTDLGFSRNGRKLAGEASRRFHRFTMKAEYAYDYGMPQWLARVDRLISPLHLERFILGRHKFSHFRMWYRDALSKYVQEMLLDSRTLSRPYLEARGVESIVRDHVRGVRNYTSQIHQLLSLELCHRLFIDQN